MPHTVPGVTDSGKAHFVSLAFFGSLTMAPAKAQERGAGTQGPDVFLVSPGGSALKIGPQSPASYVHLPGAFSGSEKGNTYNPSYL